MEMLSVDPGGNVFALLVRLFTDACDFGIKASFCKNGLSELPYDAANASKMCLDLKCMRTKKNNHKKQQLFLFYLQSSYVLPTISKNITVTAVKLHF